MPWLIVALGYLIGSIPTAYIAGRLALPCLVGFTHFLRTRQMATRQA